MAFDANIYDLKDGIMLLHTPIEGGDGFYSIFDVYININKINAT